MITVVTDFAQSFFSSNVVPTYWNDAINLVTSDFQDRIGFKFLADFYVEGTYAGTIKNQPFNGYGQIQINSFTKNLLTYDPNWKVNSAWGNPNSFKVATISYGEEFSRRLKFDSIDSVTISNCNSYSAIQLNFSQPTWLASGDRVVITKDLPSINPEYNGYAKVFYSLRGGTQATIQKGYNYTPYLESGYLWEGVEFFDIALANGGADIAIQTTNDHFFNEGDEIYLQMDGDARSSILATASPGDTITEIRLYSPTFSTFVSLLNSTVTYSVSFESFLNDIVSTINCNQSLIDGFSAYYYGTGDIFHITAPFGSNNSYNGWIPIIASYSGGTYSGSTMSNVAGLDSNGQGLNPQLSGIYKVKEVLNTDQFTITPTPTGIFSNKPGSERGSIYSMSNYKIKDLVSSPTFSLAHASFALFDPLQYKSSNQTLSELTVLGYYQGASYPDVLSNNQQTVTYEIGSWGAPFTVDIWNRSLIPPFDSQISYCKLDTYDVLGNPQSFTISNFYQNDEKLTLGFGPFNINLAYSLDPTDFDPIPAYFPITGSTSYYFIAAYNSSDVQMTNTYQIKLKEICKPLQLCWLNNFGGWEYLTFDSKVNAETIEIVRNNFLKVGNYIGADPVGQINTNMVVSYDPTKRGTTTYNMLADTTIEITTPLFKDKDFAKAFMQDLFLSPEVYMIIPGPYPDGGLYDPEDYTQQPVVIPVSLLDNELVQPTKAAKIIFYRLSLKVSQYKNGPHKIIGN